MTLDDYTLEYVNKKIDDLKKDFMDSCPENPDALDKAFTDCSVRTLNVLKLKLGLD